MGELGPPVVVEDRVLDPGHLGPLPQELGDGPGVLDVPLHTQRQGLQALQQQERVEGGQRRPDVPQQLGPGPGQVGVLPEVLPERQVVIRR